MFGGLLGGTLFTALFGGLLAILLLLGGTGLTLRLLLGHTCHVDRGLLILLGFLIEVHGLYTIGHGLVQLDAKLLLKQILGAVGKDGGADARHGLHPLEIVVVSHELRGIFGLVCTLLDGGLGLRTLAVVQGSAPNLRLDQCLLIVLLQTGTGAVFSLLLRLHVLVVALALAGHVGEGGVQGVQTLAEEMAHGGILVLGHIHQTTAIAGVNQLRLGLLHRLGNLGAVLHPLHPGLV